MTEARFIIHREADERGGRWAYIDSCPHGSDLGAIHLGPSVRDERTPTEPFGDKITWEWTDLGNGRCRISPSILAKGAHGTEEHPVDCHFGPGEFPFLWLEEGELRDREPFQTRYEEWVRGLTGSKP